MRGAWIFLLASGCVTRDVSAIDVRPDKEVLKDIPVSSNRNVDILFLIDNSPSMDEEQASLTKNFPRFIDVLQTIPGGLPSVHIGVTSSDVGIGGYAGVLGCEGTGDNGLLQNTAHGVCSPPDNGARYIEDLQNPDGTRNKNYPGQLSDVFKCIALLGTSGCGFEHHFEGMKRALDGTNPQNAGFLRKDAYLAVVILGDEDDCSAHDTTVFNPAKALDSMSSPLGPFESYRCTEFGVTCDGLASLPRTAGDYKTCVPRGDSYLWGPSHYVDFLKSLKDDPTLIIAAAIGGNPAPFGVFINADGKTELKHSCQSANGVADPGVRFKSFIDAFGQQGTFVSICQADLTDALTTIAKLLARVIGTPCLEGAIDTTDIDPSQPGLQLACQVSDVRFPGTDHQSETMVPRCPMRNDTTPDTTVVPCWWSRVNPGSCPTSISASNMELHVERNGIDPPIGTHVQARCVAH